MLHLRSFNRFILISLMMIALIMASATVQAAIATLDNLIAGGTLVEEDVLFDGFSFQDNSDVVNFPDDTVVSASDIKLITSSTASSVSLRTEIDPALALSGNKGYFDFWMDFSLSIVGSTRQLSSIDLYGGDLYATGDDAQTTVRFNPGGCCTNKLEIYEDTQYGSQTTDNFALGSLVTAMLFESVIDGGTTAANSTAGFSTFTLTFNLVGDQTQPPSVVPVPAAVWLFGTGILGLIGFSRRRNQLTS